MPFELDHVFILGEPGGPEAELLREYGLCEGEPNQHPGQGTANRRFFFSNLMLELLWVCDESEALSPPGDRLRLVERSKWRENGASPFGVCLRPAEATVPGRPFPGWTYRPAYLSSPHAIHVADNSDRTDEPLLFYLSFARRQGNVSQPPQLKEVETVRLGGLPVHRSPSADALAQVPGLKLSARTEPLLELEFGGGGPSTDFRPDLPLILRP